MSRNVESDVRQIKILKSKYISYKTKNTDDHNNIFQ